jgi:protein-tyrosine phosphatase
MAAEYFRHRVRSEGLLDWTVDSGGTLGIHGSPASTEAREAMSEIGVNLDRHRSQALSAEMLRDADFTIAMEQNHLEFLARHHPEGQDARLLIRAFEEDARPRPSAHDLADPMGSELDFYREQIPLLTRCIDHLIVYLRQTR